jgi:hypothetical protein
MSTEMPLFSEPAGMWPGIRVVAWRNMLPMATCQQAQTLCWTGSARLTLGSVVPGDALHITPIVRRGATSTLAYFPPGLWYNLYNHTVIDTTDGGKNITVEVPDPLNSSLLTFKCRHVLDLVWALIGQVLTCILYLI